MTATIESAIKRCEDTATKYETYRIQDEELWEIVYEDLQEAIDSKVIDFNIAKPTSAYKNSLMNLRGILRRKGVYISRKAGKKIMDCFSEFMEPSATGIVPVWPLDSIQALVNFEISSLSEISLGLQYICQRNKIVKGIELKDTIEPILKKGEAIKSTSSNIYSVPEKHPATFAMNDDLTRVIGNISKMYHSNEKKYGGWNDSLDYKMEMYKDICDINQFPVDCRMNGLMLALKELALSEFRNHRNDEGMTFEGMIEHFRICYEGMDFKRSELQAWNSISYKLVREQNPSKLPSECVIILVDLLNEKRRGLDASQKTDDAMHTRLTNACWGIPEFQSALSAPSPHLSTFINQLKMAVSNYQAINVDNKPNT
ncbi:hypothetical protein EV44_g3721 [Erysiphe necator]|uniref:Uncharacterized protein n=1 Tax=Uncinula necator TaxID=52586 RepID=A0A0B1NVT1_UNCNE|nr:hypothetical protein EV44_g3721 [Erysiphe necator]